MLFLTLSNLFDHLAQVRAHAVSVLQQKDDDELLCYLLQLVQALRYESSDASRLSRFLVGRGTSNPHFAVMLHWCVHRNRSMVGVRDGLGAAL